MENENGFVVTKETWENMPKEQRDWIMFETLQAMHGRLKCLEKRSLVDKVCAAGGGIIGGALAFLGLKVGA
jgi:hypothetical protein